MPVRKPTAAAKPSSQPARGSVSRALRSISSSNSVSPIKITSSSIVESPEALNFQSWSQPRVRMAESHATLESNRLLAR